MRKIFCSIICSCILSITYSCKVDGHEAIDLVNNSDMTLVTNWTNDYPDTTLRQKPYIVNNRTFLIPPYSLKTYALTAPEWESFEENFGTYFDTLMVFIFDIDVFSHFEWPFIKENYLILQRYDLSLNDLQRLNWRLFFPPSERMRNIKMWPPYGTYDALGHRRE